MEELSTQDGTDVLAPRRAVAWVVRPGGDPGRWSYSAAEVVDELERGAVVLSVDRPAPGQPGWLRDVCGTVPLGEYLSVVSELDEQMMWRRGAA